ncbi:TraR/DksA C4-type zinc finger protein [Patescibacteria group bacterium]|nr:TraR/DksA C4-type zinc finger protein [Patescibacteria group bacterium]MDE2021473.1 TraR/DksA C4-type zinc finger protein [Patescibacteria group bacterium]MDE2173408.1 TraR/DksA C4-type zinc finger protein [Patescibacteria group bacterium]
MGAIGRRNMTVPNDWEPVPSETGVEPDIVDQADVIVSRENNAAILADLEARYDTVLEALSRIEKGTYGKCEMCGKEISENRLEADPAASTCVAHL